VKQLIGDIIATVILFGVWIMMAGAFGHAVTAVTR
jgi:hypothetical protein